MRTSSGIAIGALSAVLLLACNKDELTVVSTATTPTCQKVAVRLNIDSLQDAPNGPWGSPDMHISICECDTLALIPMNIPPPLVFNKWVIDLGPDDAYYHQLVLDTITTSTELWLDFDGSTPQQDHFRIDVDVVPCD